jgi:dGTPase
VEGTAAAVERCGARSMEDVRCAPSRVASFTPDTQAASADLKRFLLSRVYTSPALDEDRRRSVGMVAELFELFLAKPHLLPDNYRLRAEDTPAHRVICDYIAGMTDAFFYRTYEQLSTSFHE